MNRQDKSIEVLQDIGHEYLRAREHHAEMVGRHEGYAILLEEVDELWDLVKQKNPSREEMRKEAVQIAAMAVAFILEVCS